MIPISHEGARGGHGPIKFHTSVVQSQRDAVWIDRKRVVAYFAGTSRASSAKIDECPSQTAFRDTSNGLNAAPFFQDGAA